MAKITRLDANVLAFASAALANERTVFGDVTESDTLDDNVTTDFFRGWGIVGPNDEPTREDFNGLGFTLGQFIAYLHQVGVAEWNGNQEYHQNSLANESGVLYLCLTNNHTSVTAPSADNVNWEPLITALKTPYDNTTTGLTAITVQAAIDEIEPRIGEGQTWQDLTASRSSGVAYTNTTGRAIMVSVSTQDASTNADASILLQVDGINVSRQLARAVNGQTELTVSAIVPNGSTYQASIGGSESINIWAELR